MNYHDFRLHFRTLRKELKSIKSFYLTAEQETQLKQRNILIRFFKTTFLILKALYFKLNPLRRILFIIALISLLSFRSSFQTGSVSFGLNMPFFGATLLIIILLLELKDKLLYKDEFQAARLIQKALIPEEPPRIPGFDIYFYYQPMNEVGGDLIDHLHDGKNQHLLALADISGKGLSAALLMSKLQGLLQAFAFDTPFEKLLTTINQKFYRTVPKQSFASLLLLQLHANKDHISIFNAGHLPPIHLHNGQIIELNKGEMAIGLTADQTYWPFSLKLNPDDYLICYSDGLTEAFNEQGRLFGEEGLKNALQKGEFLSARALTESLLSELFQFVADQPLSDDLSLIVLKKT